jgi:hypothetical protein
MTVEGTDVHAGSEPAGTRVNGASRAADRPTPYPRAKRPLPPAPEPPAVPAEAVPAPSEPVADREQPHGTPPPAPRTRRGAVRAGVVALILVLAGGVVGFAASAAVPTEYAARVDLLYPLSTEQPTGFLREDRNLTTQLLLIGNRAALTEVGAAHGLTPEQLEAKLSVEVVESSEIIRAEVRDGSPERALAVVDAVVARYLAFASGQRSDPVREWVQGQLDATRERLSTSPEDVVLLDRERALVAQLDSITTDELSRPRPSVLAPAYSLPDPVSPGPALTTAAGLLLGVLVAAPVVLRLARKHLRP